MAVGFFTGTGEINDTSIVTANASDVLENKVIVDKYGNAITGTIKGMDGVTITPSSNQNIIKCANHYMLGNITINSAKTFKLLVGQTTSSYNQMSIYIDGAGRYFTMNSWTLSFSGFKSVDSVFSLQAQVIQVCSLENLVIMLMVLIHEFMDM